MCEHHVIGSYDSATVGNAQGKGCEEVGISSRRHLGAAPPAQQKNMRGCVPADALLWAPLGDQREAKAALRQKEDNFLQDNSNGNILNVHLPWNLDLSRWEEWHEYLI